MIKYTKYSETSVLCGDRQVIFGLEAETGSTRMYLKDNNEQWAYLRSHPHMFKKLDEFEDEELFLHIL